VTRGPEPAPRQRRQDQRPPAPLAGGRSFTTGPGYPRAGLPHLPPPRSSTLPAMSVDLSGEITATATAVLAVFAIVTAVFAVLAFRKQSKEVGILQLQMEDQHDANMKQAQALERQAYDRRRAQASRVYIRTATVYPNRGTARVIAQAVNASELPIYDAGFWIRLPDGEPHFGDPVGVILPGDAMTGGPEYALGTDPAEMEVVLSFRDAAGVFWVRLPAGFLADYLGGQVKDAVREAFETPGAVGSILPSEDQQDPTSESA